MTGRASYHEGGLPGSFKANNPDTQAGILPSTIDDPKNDKPKLAAGTATVNHDLSVKWNCGPKKAATELVSKDPK